ncbi:MAG: hypothetical protein GY757_09010 [bacterium]|nr:hypothetical protein [bacterium]
MNIDFVFLLKAINKGENLFLFHKEARKVQRYFSRFYDVMSKENSIIIDFPYADSYSQKHLEPGEPISATFHTAGFRFQFDSTIKEEFMLETGKIKIPALKIAWPEDVVDGNRRSLFRLSVNMDKTINVKYTILPDRESDDAGQPAPREYEGVETVMIDISRDGVAVEINNRNSIETGNIVRLNFRLEEQGEELEIKGIARNVRPLASGRRHICGIQFSPDTTAKYKKNLQKIVCYIMAGNHDNVTFFAVNQVVSKNPYVHKIVANEVTEEVVKMVLAKQIPLTDEEYLESLVYILENDKFKTLAAAQLELIPFKVKETYIQRINANDKVAFYVLTDALEHFYSKIIAAVINNQYLPLNFLTTIAEKGSTRMLRMLLANKVKLIAYPELMDIMEENPEITTSLRAKIKEVRKSYLNERQIEIIPEEAGEEVARLMDEMDEFDAAYPAEQQAKPPVTSKETAGGTDGIDTAQTVISNDAYEEMKVIAGGDNEAGTSSTSEVTVKPPEDKAKTLSTLKDINRLSTQKKVKLAIAGNKDERIILAKDSNKFVAMALVDNPKVGGEEILVLAKNQECPREVIVKICNNKEWLSNYSILNAVIRNPKVPIVKAPVLVKNLQDDDLRELAENQRINPVIRNLARHFMTKRTGKD